jgi:small subunit ribosomal protein S7e
VPFRQHAKFKKIQSRLIRELEKKFSGKHVFFLAQRTILTNAVYCAATILLRAETFSRLTNTSIAIQLLVP